MRAMRRPRRKALRRRARAVGMRLRRAAVASAPRTLHRPATLNSMPHTALTPPRIAPASARVEATTCLLYTSDAADDM
eukprot:12082011-Alexandrium_andersonii.AAC.1